MKISKKIAAIQSSYIPWKGYLDIINSVDEFVLYDDVQYTKKNWRNRNRIKSQSGSQWLTIPVIYKTHDQKIQDTEVVNNAWKRKHWRSIAYNYQKAKYFQDYKDFFEDLYLGTEEKFLSKINYRFLNGICKILGVHTKLSFSKDFDLAEDKVERVIDLCKQTGATEFLSGPVAKPYLDEQSFAKEGIRLTWMDYLGYPEYDQLYPPFDHYVTVLDVIFNCGPESPFYIWGWRNRQ